MESDGSADTIKIEPVYVNESEDINSQDHHYEMVIVAGLQPVYEARDPLDISPQDEPTTTEQGADDVKEEPQEIVETIKVEEETLEECSNDSDLDEDYSEGDARESDKEARGFSCEVCGRHFPFEDVLRKHRALHRAGRYFECAYCDQSFFQEEYLAQHLTKCHSNYNHCEVCHKKCSSKREYLRHQRRHSRPVQYKCLGCPKLYDVWGYLEAHVKTHTEDIVRQCQDCGETFENLYELQCHSFTHSGTATFRCPTCKKLFLRARNLREHLLTHEKDQNFMCEICNVTFCSKKALQIHKRIHSNRDLKCEVCGHLYRLRPALEKHMLLHK